MSRTAAPSGAPVRARVALASVTSLASSGSSSATLGTPFPIRVVGRHPADLTRAGTSYHDGGDPHSTPAVLAALGEHGEARDLGLGTGQGNPAKALGEQ